jgi:hypothetical protein
MGQRLFRITHTSLIVLALMLFFTSLVGFRIFQAWSPQGQALRSVALINGSVHYGSFAPRRATGLAWYVGPAAHMRDFEWSWRPTWRRSGFFNYFHLQIPIIWMLLPIGLLWVLARVIRRRLQTYYRSAGLCTTCRYDLRGSRGACPECGTPVADLSLAALDEPADRITG